MITESKRLQTANRVCEALQKGLGSHLWAVMLKGSALKPDEVIEGYSDLDLHAFVSPSILHTTRVLQLEWSIRMQEALGSIDLSEGGFGDLQVFFLNGERYPGEWTPPVSGRYRMIYEACSPHIPAFDPVQARQNAGSVIRQCESWAETLIDRFADKPDSFLPKMVRLAGTYLKGAVYSCAILLYEDPHTVRHSSFGRILQQTAEAIFPEYYKPDDSPLVRFFHGVREWMTIKDNPAQLRSLFGLAVESLIRIAQGRMMNGSEPPLESANR